MQNYKLIEVLKTLNKKELKKFGEYINSPFFNKNVNVKKVYDALSLYYPEFDSKNLTIEKLFAKVFPKDKYNYHKINNVISDLYKLSESFLQYTSSEKDSKFNKHYLMNSLIERGLMDICEQIEKSYKKELDSVKIKDENYYYYLYKFYSESLDMNVTIKPGDHPEIIQNEFDSYLQYALVTLLKLYMYMHHIRKQNKVNFDMKMFDSFSKYVKETDFEDNPAYMLYKGIMMLELNKEKKYFLKLKSIKEKYSERLSATDLKNSLIFMTAFSAEMINKYGDESYYKEEFELIKDMIEIKLFTPENTIYPNLINIFKSACVVEEYAWAEKFLNEYIETIDEKDRSNTLNCCYGYMYYRKKKFDKALEYFAKTNFQWFILKIFVKTITLRIYYEVGMFEEAISFIDSYRHYLHNDDKILDDNKAIHNRFLKFTTALIKIRMNDRHTDNSFEIAKLKKQIEAMENNFFGVKKWLQKKIKELE